MKPRILLLEDNIDVGQHYARLLKSAGYEVHRVLNANEALKVFQDDEKTPDLAILDVKIEGGPEKNLGITNPKEVGIEFAKKIRAAKPIPIIFITAEGQDIREKILQEKTIGPVTFFQKTQIDQDENLLFDNISLSIRSVEPLVEEAPVHFDLGTVRRKFTFKDTAGGQNTRQIVDFEEFLYVRSDGGEIIKVVLRGGRVLTLGIRIGRFYAQYQQLIDAQNQEDFLIEGNCIVQEVIDNQNRLTTRKCYINCLTVKAFNSETISFGRDEATLSINTAIFQELEKRFPYFRSGRVD